MKLWQGILTGVLFGLLAGGALWLILSPPRGEALALAPPATPAPVAVHVAGAVRQPGVYTLPAGSRVENAVQAAGGFSEEAIRDQVNLAAALQDGQKISIPARRPQAEADQSGQTLDNTQKSSALEAGEPININTATVEQLDSLPGIGSSKAAAIVAYREKNGPFSAIEAITNVPGIGDGIFASIKDLITVE